MRYLQHLALFLGGPGALPGFLFCFSLERHFEDINLILQLCHQFYLFESIQGRPFRTLSQRTHKLEPDIKLVLGVQDSRGTALKRPPEYALLHDFVFIVVQAPVNVQVRLVEVLFVLLFITLWNVENTLRLQGIAFHLLLFDGIGKGVLESLVLLLDHYELGPVIVGPEIDGWLLHHIVIIRK